MTDDRLKPDRTHLPRGATVLCAVSGGADSVCLLSLLRQEKDITLHCAHYDHGIRGESAHRDAEFVAELCRTWEIPFHTECGDVPAWAREHGMGIEEAARTLRYEFLGRTAEKLGGALIVTAHTMNDQAETVLFRLARGTGLRGLCGIPAERDGIVRPLLGVTRQEIEAYLRENGIPWVEDETNALDDYARNRVRHTVLPAMEAVHPGATRSIAQLCETVREDEEYLSSLAADFVARCGGERLSISELLALPECVARRALRQWYGAELSRVQTDALLSLCLRSPSASLDLPGGSVRREYDALCLSPAESVRLPDRELAENVPVPLPECGLEAMLTVSEQIQNSLNTFCFSYGSICGTVYVTARRAGDAVCLRGRTGTHRLKTLFSDAHIPAHQRDRIPVVRDAAGILAVYGFGCAERGRPQAGEPVIKITFKEITGEKEK